MLQFLIGLSNVNVNWLFSSLLGGLQFYNSPPLFFVAGTMLLITGFYGFRLRLDLLWIIFVIGALSVLASILHGFDSWHLRQGATFIVAATIWVFVYQVAWKRDIFTLENSKIILAIYLAFLVVANIEHIFGSEALVSLVSCVVTHGCDNGYLVGGRYTFFSVEPASATLAIAATIMPYLCANAVVKKSWPSFGLMALGLLLLVYSEGLTAQVFLAFSFGFVFLPRLAVISVPVLLGLIAIISANVSFVLGEPGGITELVQSWFGGIYSRVDAGIESGSYITHVMVWLIGARAFLSAPLTGLGIGGTQGFFYTLSDTGYYIVMGDEQRDMVDGYSAAYNSPMVVRIPAEIGLLGTAFLAYYGWKAFKMVFDRGHDDPILYYAYVYSLGAMLLSFCFSPDLVNPCINGFVAILAQTLRARQAFKRAAPVVSGPILIPNFGAA